MSGIPISGTTTGAAGASLGVAGTTGHLPSTDVPQSLLGGAVSAVEGHVSALPFTGLGLLSLLVAAFTLLACGLALVSLVRPARRT